MNKIGNYLRFTCLLSLLLGLCVFPALAQDCSQSCSSKTCGQSCDKKADTCSATCDEACSKTACTQQCPHSGAKMDFNEMAASMANCEICKNVFEDQALMQGCDYSVAKYSNGLIFDLYLKDSSLRPVLDAHAKKDLAMTKKFQAMCPKERSTKLCPICDHYFMFLDKGLKEERIMTPNGAMTILSTDDPELVKAVHGYGDMINEMKAGFDAMMGDGGQAPCSASATCSASSTCSATASASCCGSDACKASKGTCASTSSSQKELPAEFLAELQNCHICKAFCEQPEMMTAADCKIMFLKQGLIFCNTVKDPKMIKPFQNLEHKMLAAVEELKKLPHEEAMNKVCFVCKMFADLGEKGVTMEFEDTPTGTLTVITGTDDGQVSAIHQLGKTMEKMMQDMSF